MSKLIANQLKSLKHERTGGCPDAAWLASTRETLLMQIQNTVTEDAPQRGWSLFSSTVKFFSGDLARVAAVPLAVLALVLTSHLGAAATISFAHGSLPGDPLYNVKLTAERLSLALSGRAAKVQLELDIAGRRLDEMTRIAAGVDPDKNDKLARVAGLFTATMTGVRSDLQELRADDADEAMSVALLIDSRSDDYQKRFAQGNLADRSNLRLAALSLDQASISALELIVDRTTVASNAPLPEAQLTSKVGRSIEAVASRVAAAPDAPSAVQANAAVQEAKALLSAGDFKAAVLKAALGADLMNQTTDTTASTSTPATASATDTPDSSATSTPPSH